MTLLNAAVLALWPVLPMLIVCYVRHLIGICGGRIREQGVKKAPREERLKPSF